MRIPLRLAASAAVLSLAAGHTGGATPEEAEQKVLGALQRGSSIPAQAENLMELVWPRDGRADPVVAARARKELVGFGLHAMAPFRSLLSQFRPEYQADAVTAFIEARANVPGATPPEYVPGLEDMLWFGTRAAKRIAMLELARYQSPHAVLPIIDSVLDDPDLLLEGVRALGVIGNERARFFLERVLHEERPELREEAATALARLGGKGQEPLRNALRSPSREIRLVAARAVLPAAGEEDLTALYEYLTDHPDDDPATAAAVRLAAENIERVLEAKRAADAATPSKDF